MKCCRVSGALEHSLQVGFTVAQLAWRIYTRKKKKKKKKKKKMHTVRFVKL